ncbi:hypothetical protein [Staphylococcus simulans]|uniref:hypothetical protein n=1 Tax=Staphylococcus simulans TaxID=1286 RepID=UPI0021D14D06|nr:hypothetical protein [Staphylococcus simulans]UXV37756.1 hypothetical protein MUA87_01065 [Staphylococcus simulans]UXV40204.1 hypothetical protein MUA56_01065 [Staphylococcus simulans]
MLRWRFPHGINLTPTGHNNTAIEMFLDNIVDSLTREVLQNSLDAHNENVSKPVKVTIEKLKIKTNEIPGISAVENALEEAKKMWEELENEDTIKYLSEFEETISNEHIDILKISDYNTTGLNEKSYNSLIVGNGYSQKNSEDSAGSKGIGKAAPFAASKLRMVFYNTVPTKNREKSAGIMNFVSFYKDKKRNDITQERSTYAEKNQNYIDGQTVFNSIKRDKNEFGTDLFVLGLKDFNWKESVLLSTVNNFLLSIFEGDLEVVAFGVVLNKDTLHDVLEKLKEYKMVRKEKIDFENTLKYYDVLTNKETISFEFDERFDKYEFIEKSSDGLLKLLKHEPANRSVLQTRKAGMKIYERKNINGHINFTGVFQAKGSRLNAFLKEMENANHDKWSPDRLIKGKKKIAENLLKDLFQWYKEVVKASYELESSDEVEAFGVKDLLPMRDNEEKNQEKIDSGIQNKVESFKLVKKDKKSSVNDGDKKEDVFKKIADEIDGGKGDSSGLGSDRKGQGGGGNPDQTHGTGVDEGDNGGNEKKVIGQREINIGTLGKVKVKVVEIDSSLGEYKFICIPFKSFNNIKISLDYIGADGDAFKLDIINVASNDVSTNLVGNDIYLEDIRKDKPIVIEFKTRNKLRMKMGASIYEIKN